MAAYIFNCNSWVRDYTSFHQRFLGPLKVKMHALSQPLKFYSACSFQNCKKLGFLDSLARLADYIDSENPPAHRLPPATSALEEDQKIFPNALKLWHKDIKCTVKVGPTALQISTTDKQKVCELIPVQLSSCSCL